MSSDSKKKYEFTSPLLACVPQVALDAVFGAAALIDPGMNLQVLSRNWNEFMARSGRNDLSRNSVLGSSVLQFFRDEQQKQVFRNLLESMANDELGTHNQVVDLGQRDNHFYVQFHVHPVWNEGLMLGYFLHCIDATKEHANRLSMIDHDRQLLKLRELKDTYEAELKAAREKIGEVTREQSQRDKDLIALREKAERKEKALKAAIKQAEVSANNMVGKDKELEQLRKKLRESEDVLASVQSELEASASEVHTREESLDSLRQQVKELTAQLESTTGRLEAASRQDEDAEAILAAETEKSVRLASELEASKREADSLRQNLDEVELQLTELQASYKTLQETSAENSADAAADMSARSVYQDLIAMLASSTTAFGSQLCKEIQTRGGASFAVCTIHGDEPDTFRILAQNGAPESFRVAAETDQFCLRSEGGPCSLHAVDGQPTRCKELQSNPEFDSWAADAEADHYDCIWTFAIQDEYSEIGSLQLYFESDPDLTETQIQTIDSLVNEMSPLVRLGLKMETMDQTLRLADRMIDSFSDPVCWIDSEGRIQFANASFCELTNHHRTPCLGTKLSHRLSDAAHQELQAFLDNPFERETFEITLEDSADGSRIVLMPQYENGRFVGCYGCRKAPDAPPTAAPVLEEGADRQVRTIRYLTRDLADAFGDLLTAVVGHASLAAADAQEQSPALADIRAIERSAGDAARLVRKLHALSGASKHSADADLHATLTHFLKKRPGDTTVEADNSSFRVAADSSTLEVVLQGMISHAESVASDGGTLRWSLCDHADQAKLSLSFPGKTEIPNGWFEGDLPGPEEFGYDLCFAREAARAVGGTLEILETKKQTELALLLPLSAASLQVESA